MAKAARANCTSSIECLPFIGKRKLCEPGSIPRHFWRVSPTGDYTADCRTGVELAIQYLAYEEADRLSPGGGCTILGLIVQDMPRPLTGIEIGFLQMVAFAAVDGAERSRRIASHWAKRNQEAAA